MDAEFWHARWEKSETGFHLEDTNPLLKKYWQNLQADSNDTIFVPLCGKSLDLLWIARHVKHIIGVELSQKAVDGFFTENNIQPTVTQSEYFREYRHANITLFCGDFFKLSPNNLPDCHFVYDRASLIAFPPEMRQRYATKLARLIPKETRRLLVTMEYPQQEMSGPPFSVPPKEVDQHFSQRFDIQCLQSEDILDASQRFKDKGVTRMFEHVFLLERKPA